MGPRSGQAWHEFGPSSLRCGRPPSKARESFLVGEAIWGPVTLRDPTVGDAQNLRADDVEIITEL